MKMNAYSLLIMIHLFRSFNIPAMNLTQSTFYFLTVIIIVYV